jgi:CRISPR-associated protein Csx17
MSASLNILSFPGINTECLGHYLIGLGLLKAVGGKWPTTRGFWRDGVFNLASELSSSDEIEHYLQKEWTPNRYEKWWVAAQKLDTKARSSRHLRAERSQRSVKQVRVADSTIVGVRRNQFNPLFGTGGNIGKRNLETAWCEARALCADKDSAKWLRSTLSEFASQEVPPFTNAGTWFVYNNKTFNSGLRWYREGRLSPWSFLLAMEGALLIRGGSGRRLGSRARPYAAYPFVSQALQPSEETEVGQKTAGEFWAPLWKQPATLGEVETLFQRGLARLGGRAASEPHEFAVAALAAGTDAGISQFIRFEFRQTTSSQVYEAIPRGIFLVPPKRTRDHGAHPSTLLNQIVGARWLDQLPFEPATKKSKLRFAGLRGPIARQILSVAADPANPEAWQQLLLKLAQIQGRIDRNPNWRKRNPALPFLFRDWFRRAFPDGAPLEVRVAAALASLGSRSDYPALCNVFGVKLVNNLTHFMGPGRPQRAVWHDGQPAAALLDLVDRRLLDAQQGSFDNMHGAQPLDQSDVATFLSQEGCDLHLVQRWLPAMSLVDWSGAWQWEISRREPSGGPLLLWSFFKPFFVGDDILLSACNFRRPASKPKPAFARQLFALLRNGAVEQAIALARTGYQAEGLPVIKPPSPSRDFDSARLAIAMALPVRPLSLACLVERWLQPAKQTEETAP